MSDSYENTLETELESLLAIYVNELTYSRNSDGTVNQIELLLHPATGHDITKQYVCMTLVFTLNSKYPYEPPNIEIRNPRGLGEEEICSLVEDMILKADDMSGDAMLYTLIEMTKDYLTDGNVPRCPCVVCLEHFHDAGSFHRTECYHYFHTRCLYKYITHTRAQNEEEDREFAETRHIESNSNDKSKTKQILCPVCRSVLDDESLTVTCSAQELQEDENAEEFILPLSLKEQQLSMAQLYEHQKAKGGIIDLELERNKYLVNPEDRMPIRSLVLPATTSEDTTDKLPRRQETGGRNKDKSKTSVRQNNSSQQYRNNNRSNGREDYHSGRSSHWHNKNISGSRSIENAEGRINRKEISKTDPDLGKSDGFSEKKDENNYEKKNESTRRMRREYNGSETDREFMERNDSEYVQKNEDWLHKDNASSNIDSPKQKSDRTRDGYKSGQRESHVRTYYSEMDRRRGAYSHGTGRYTGGHQHKYDITHDKDKNILHNEEAKTEDFSRKPMESRNDKVSANHDPSLTSKSVLFESINRLDNSRNEKMSDGVNLEYTSGNENSLKKNRMTDDEIYADKGTQGASGFYQRLERDSDWRSEQGSYQRTDQQSERGFGERFERGSNWRSEHGSNRRFERGSDQRFERCSDQRPQRGSDHSDHADEYKGGEGGGQQKTRREYDSKENRDYHSGGRGHQDRGSGSRYKGSKFNDRRSSNTEHSGQSHVRNDRHQYRSYQEHHHQPRHHDNRYGKERERVDRPARDVPENVVQVQDNQNPEAPIRGGACGADAASETGAQDGEDEADLINQATDPSWQHSNFGYAGKMIEVDNMNKLTTTNTSINDTPIFCGHDYKMDISYLKHGVQNKVDCKVNNDWNTGTCSIYYQPELNLNDVSYNERDEENWDDEIDVYEYEKYKIRPKHYEEYEKETAPRRKYYQDKMKERCKQQMMIEEEFRRIAKEKRVKNNEKDDERSLQHATSAGQREGKFQEKSVLELFKEKQAADRECSKKLREDKGILVRTAVKLSEPASGFVSSSKHRLISCEPNISSDHPSKKEFSINHHDSSVSINQSSVGHKKVSDTSKHISDQIICVEEINKNKLISYNNSYQVISACVTNPVTEDCHQQSRFTMIQKKYCERENISQVTIPSTSSSKKALSTTDECSPVLKSHVQSLNTVAESVVLTKARVDKDILKARVCKDILHKDNDIVLKDNRNVQQNNDNILKDKYILQKDIGTVRMDNGNLQQNKYNCILQKDNGTVRNDNDSEHKNDNNTIPQSFIKNFKKVPPLKFPKKNHQITPKDSSLLYIPKVAAVSKRFLDSETLVNSHSIQQVVNDGWNEDLKKVCHIPNHQIPPQTTSDVLNMWMSASAADLSTALLNSYATSSLISANLLNTYQKDFSLNPNLLSSYITHIRNVDNLPLRDSYVQNSTDTHNIVSGIQRDMDSV